MSSTETHRKPLHPIPNGQHRLSDGSPAKKISQSPSKTKILSPGLKRTTQNSVTSNIDHSYVSESQKGTEATSRPMRPRARSSNTDKRVSFGGREIKVFSPEHDDSSPEVLPPPKSSRTVDRSSPSPRRTSTQKRTSRDAVITSDEWRNTPNMKDASSLFKNESNSRSSSRSKDPSLSPIPVRTNNRQSFGIFANEDIPEGKIIPDITDTYDDTTGFISAMDEHSPGRLSSPGNITSCIPALMDIAGLVEDNLTETAESFPAIPTGQATSKPFKKISSDESSNPNDNDKENDLMELDNTLNSPTQNSKVPNHMRPEKVRSFQIHEDDYKMQLDDELHQTNDTPTGRDEGESITSSRGNDSEITKQINSMRLFIDEDEGNDNLSVAPLVPVREALPESRQLFATDEDTIHYHLENGIFEQQNSRPDLTTNQENDASGEINEAKEHITDVQSTISERAESTSQQQTQSEQEQRTPSDAIFHPADERDKPSSSTSALERDVTAVPSSSKQLTQPEDEPKFSISEFLKTVNIRFESNAPVQRELSLAPNPNTFSLKKGTTGHKLLESVRESSLLATIESQIASLKQDITAVRSRTVKIEDSIHEDMPLVYKKMQSHSSLPLHELTSSRLSLKRLRKLCSLQAKLEWVTNRQRWEKSVLSELRSASTSLQQDSQTLRNTTEYLQAFHDESERNLQKLGITISTTNASRNSLDESDVVARREVVRELSIVRDLKTYYSNIAIEETELLSKASKLSSLKTQLESKCAGLKGYAIANTASKLRKLVSEQVELNSIVSGVSGLQPVFVDKKALSLRIHDIMNVKFSLHEDRVINSFCEATPQGRRSHPAWATYVQAATNILGSSELSKDTRFVRQLPLRLRCVSRALLSAKISFEDALMYFERHLGEIASADVATHEGQECVQLSVIAPFYSIALRSKFDVRITILTQPLHSSDIEPPQVILLDEITRQLGDTPTDISIRETIEDSRHTRNGAVCVSAIFSAIWDALR